MRSTSGPAFLAKELSTLFHFDVALPISGVKMHILIAIWVCSPFIGFVSSAIFLILELKGLAKIPSSLYKNEVKSRRPGSGWTE